MARNTVAICQLTAKDNKEDNFNICKSLIEESTKAGAKVIFLPEASDFVAESKDQAISLSEPLDGETISKYKEMAKNLNVWLSLGGFHEKVDDCGKVHNAHIIINDNGEIAAVYRKIHLFDVEIPEHNMRLKESDFIQRGEEIVPPVKSPIGEIGLSICYDVRFPELSLSLRNLGAKILTYPSAFTYATGALHWEVLLRCRAIENQCYVIAAAQTGKHNNKRQSWGHAMIVDPLGNITAQCSEGTGFVLANIDLDIIEHARKNMPVSLHRRYDIYPKMVPVSSTQNEKTEFSLHSCRESCPSSIENNKHQFGSVLIEECFIFYKTDLTMAFVNKRCVVPGHVLVAPFRVAPRLSDLSSNEVSDLFLTVQKVESVMEKVHGASSTTIAIQDGPDAGRSIEHLHVHILPRKKGDFLQNDQIYYELQQHDKDENKPWRSDTEMLIEADELKKYFS